MRRLTALLLPLLFAVACSEPPNKELDTAQGAIDAARAAGAEQYAPEAFAAATSALQQAREAVTQRDYRLALTRALDAHDRAQEAARGAADGKARVRGEAESAITAAATAVQRLETRIGADATRLAKRDIDAARRAHADAVADLQKTRALFSTGGYLDAREEARAIGTRITEQLKKLDSAAPAKPARPIRRRR